MTEQIAKSKKTGKKGFYEVEAPLTSTKIQLYAGSQEELVGKIVTLDLTRSLRGKSLVMKFKVTLEGNKLVGEPVSLELVGSFVRRMMRTGVDYVEDSFIVEAKDAKVVVKPFLITRNKVSRAVRKELRNETKRHLESLIKTRTSREIFAEITANKVQKDLYIKLKKIYPLALSEIRVFEIVKDKSALSVQGKN